MNTIECGAKWSVNGLAIEGISLCDTESLDSMNVPSVKIEDLRYPFTTKEFVEQKFPSPLQKPITRPVAERMIDKREEFMVALKAFAKEKKEQTYYQRLVKMGTWAYKKWILILILMFISFYIYNLSRLEWDAIVQWDPIVNWRTFWSGFEQENALPWLGVVAAAVFVHRKGLKFIPKVALQIISCILLYYIISKYIVPVYSGPSLTVGTLTEPLLPALLGITILITQIFGVFFLLVPAFRSAVLGAIRIEEDRSELMAQYAEKNLDVLLSPMRPAGMQKIILENYPRYGDQKRSAAQGVEFQAYIRGAKEDKITFPNDLQEIFSQKSSFEKIRRYHDPHLSHFDWCLVGMWAFGEVKPNEGSDWGEKLDYIQFARLTFAQCIYNYASESGITPARLEKFKEDFPDIDCLHDDDKREQFIIDSISDKNTNVEQVLEKLTEKK